MNSLVEKLNPSVRIGWPRTIYNYEKQKTDFKTKLSNLVLKQESFSLIIMGPPGCGKNTFFESCVGELNSSSNKDFYNKRKIIRLNGLVCGRDLKSSINEIFTQLNISDAFDFDKEPLSFDDRLDSILDLLRSKLRQSGTSKNSRILIFVLDKLEYFCEGVQLLLYNLFDACASGQACLGVIGLTSRVDITEMFEKRVKSRFSHRIINLVGGRSWEDYLAMANGLMQLENNTEWNKKMTPIMQSPQTTKILKMLHDTDKSIGRLSIFLYEVALSSKTQAEIPANIVKTWENYNCSSKFQQCLDLTVYDLLLMLAIKKLHPEPFQYETLMQEISELTAKFKLGRNDLLPSFRTLEEMELIALIKAGPSKSRDKALYRSNVTIDDINKAFKKYPNLPMGLVD